MQNGFSPYEAETQDIDQRRKYAELLRQQGMAPLQAQSVGGMTARISPLEGLAKMLNAYSGSKGVEIAGQERKDLMGRMDTERSTDMAALLKAYGGTPARPQVMGADDQAMIADQGGEANPMTQAIPGDPWKAMQIAASSKSPQVQAFVPELFKLTQKENKPFSLKPGEVQYDASGKPIVANTNQSPEKGFKVGDVRKMRVGRNEITQEYQPDGTWKEIAKGDVDKPPQVNVSAPVTPVTIADPNDPNKTIIIDGRTRQKLGDGPKLTQTGTSAFERKTKMTGLGDAIQKAEDLLSGIKRDAEGNPIKGDLPTGSGFGSVIDSAAGFFGASPAGAKEAADLKVVAGQLISKVPRMEGPQSDKDVALYKQMAADAGNEKLPRDRRLSAVRTMKDLYLKYEHLNQEQEPDRRATPRDSTKRVVVDY